MADLNINSATGESVSQGRSPRFSLWIAFLVFSTITLGSSVEIKNDAEDPNEAAKWAVACSALTFSVTAIVTLMHIVPVASTFIVGTVMEGLLSLILVGFWAATVAIVTKTSNELAFVSASREMNANLFFFSWAGFVTSLILMVGYLKSAMGVDVLGEMNQRGARLTFWAALIATNFIVMGSSLRVMNDECSPNEFQTEKYCKRAKFGIALGAVGFAFSLIIVTLKLFFRISSVMLEFSLALVLTIMNGFGVAFITSNSGPGSSIGNLYFGSWITFLVTGAVASECFNQFQHGGDAATNNSATKEQEDTHSTDYPVEDLHGMDNI